MTRSITLEYGRKREATPQTRETLVQADFANRIFTPNIVLDPSITESMPAGHHTRILETHRGIVSATVTHTEEVNPGATANTSPAFYDALAAAGFTINNGVATLGPVPNNATALSCELYDGIKRTRAWGVRGLVEVFADKVCDPVRVNFNGKGHGDEADQTSWPGGIIDTALRAAIFEGCYLRIGGVGGFVPELYSFRFSTMGEPTLVDNAQRGDGMVEYFLSQTQAGLTLGVWQNTKAQRDWLQDALESVQADLEFVIPLSNTLELALTGSVLIMKNPQRTPKDNVGAYPLEMKFDRTQDVVFTQRLIA